MPITHAIHAQHGANTIVVAGKENTKKYTAHPPLSIVKTTHNTIRHVFDIPHMERFLNIGNTGDFPLLGK